MEGMKRCFALGEEAAQHVRTSRLDLGPKKCSKWKRRATAHFVQKKRYIARIYEKPDENAGEYDYKGVELKRRDNSLFLRKLYKKCLHGMVPLKGEALTRDEIVHQIRSAITEEMMRLVHNRVDMEDFIISKSLKKTYKNPNLPHVVLAEKLRKRIRDGDLVAEPPPRGQTRLRCGRGQTQREVVLSNGRSQLGATRTGLKWTAFTTYVNRWKNRCCNFSNLLMV